MRDMEEEEDKTEAGKPRKERSWWRRWLCISVIGLLPCSAFLAFCLLALFLAAWFAAPYILPLVSFPEIIVDLSPNMQNAPPGMFRDQTLTAKYGVERKPSGYRVMAKGRVLGWPFTVSADVNLSLKFFGVDANGTADVRLDGSQFGVNVKFEASLPGGWRADVTMPEVSLADSDPFLKSMLSRHPEEIVRSLVFDGIVSLTAHAEQENIFRGIPKWEAKARIKNLDVSSNANGKPTRIENFRIGIGAKGIADHVDLDPMFAHIEKIESAGFTLTNAYASIRATETAFLVTEAGSDFCGGALRLYAMFLDPQKLNAGVTIYLDGIDAGKVLSHVNGFRGEATGTLNGKLPVRLKNGNELHFGSCYLHSVPGDTGNIKLYDPSPITDNLMLGGVPKETADNLANALADLDYSALKIGFVPEGDDEMALSVKLEGTAERGEVTVPVSFTVTFHGHIEQLINTGLRVATRKEQKK